MGHDYVAPKFNTSHHADNRRRKDRFKTRPRERSASSNKTDPDYIPHVHIGYQKVSVLITPEETSINLSRSEKFIVPIQSTNKYPYYHRRYRRVPTVDECEYNDVLCIYEADSQYRRDKLVDEQIVKILRNRKIECKFWEGPDAKVKCKKICDDYDQAATNWFIKYGDIGATGNVITAYMKQKHRLVWERRNPDSTMRS